MQGRIDLRPMSVNEAWQGRRFKTSGYKSFEEACLYLLPRLQLPKPPFEVQYVFGFSNKLADLGNPEKLITDILCKKYGFNDKDIYRMVLEKDIVVKGQEYFTFQISHYAKPHKGIS
mgnify:CR=1 FL=1